jgi:hypothetical protein
MNRLRLPAIFVVISLLLISPSAHAKKKPAPANWTSTTGVVASGSPQSHGTPAVRSDSTGTAVNPITNLGCPNSVLPSDVETVVAQGEVTAPAGTTAPTWELTTNGNIVLQNNNAFVLVAHVTGYIGIAAPGCVDFASCSPTLTPFAVADVEVGGGGSNQTVIPFIQDTGATVALANTAVFFLTVTTQHPVSLGGSLMCASGSFIPVAHNQVL